MAWLLTMKILFPWWVQLHTAGKLMQLADSVYTHTQSQYSSTKSSCYLSISITLCNQTLQKSALHMHKNIGSPLRQRPSVLLIKTTSDVHMGDEGGRERERENQSQCYIMLYIHVSANTVWNARVCTHISVFSDVQMHILHLVIHTDFARTWIHWLFSTISVLTILCAPQMNTQAATRH